MSGNLFSIEGLMELAMDASNLTHSKKQATVYLGGEFGSGDKITPDKGGDSTGVGKGMVPLSAFEWGHYKQIDATTGKAASTEQIGMVIAVPMYNGSVPLFHQSIYEGKKMKGVNFQLTNYNTTGKLESFGTVTASDVSVACVYYRYYTENGPLAFVGLLAGTSAVTIDKKSFKHTAGT